MFVRPEIMNMAARLSSHASERLGLVARNIANADTPGYHAQDLAPFADSYQPNDEFVLRSVRLDQTKSIFSENKEIMVPLQVAAMSPNGNDVSLEDEMMRASVIRQDHELALSIYKSSLDILRASLGRR